MKKSESKVQKIFDEKQLTNVGIALWRDEVIQKITENSGKLAKGNEYQVHYWAVVIRYTGKDGSILDLSIPTVFFNYEQFVSSAHIDFELDDVDNVSEQIEILHNIEAKKILDRIAEMNSILPNMEYEIWYTELNSLHRHPGGRRQGFSGTDLRKDHTHNTGIVFPLIKAENRANFASIVAHEEGRTFLARTEYRLATGDIKEKDGITYQKGRCVSIVHAKPKEPSFAEKLMGFKTEEISYTIHDNGFNPDGDLTFIDHIEKWWSVFDYVSNTDFILAENVKPAVKSTHTKGWNYGYEKQAKPQQHYVKNDNNYVIKHPEKDLLDYLFDDKEIRFPTKAEIKADYKDDRLLKLYNEMEEHYYGGQHELTEHSTTYPDVMELHDCILEELSEAFDEMIDEAVDMLDEDEEFIAQDDAIVDFMRKDLTQAGMFTARDIQSAPSTQIIQWYKEMFGE